jgi:hypothetical protein
MIRRRRTEGKKGRDSSARPKRADEAICRIPMVCKAMRRVRGALKKSAGSAVNARA